MATSHLISARTDPSPKFGAPQLRPIEKIAVMTDFSPGSNTALRCAAMLARSYAASLVLAHAYLPPSCACSAPELAMVFETFDARRQSLEDRLRNATHDFSPQSIPCTIALIEGGPADLLEELNDADLIVVGTSGATGLQKALLGSTAEMVFRTSSRPVLTVGPHCSCTGEGKTALGIVLCAVDLSSESAETVAFAHSIAKQFNAELVMLHVIEDPDVVFALEQACARVEVLEKLRTLVPKNDNAAGTVYLVDFGNADERILTEARHYDAQLIVIGAHRTRVPALASRFAGGTAYSVAANADCPVLTVPRVNSLTPSVTGITESQQCRE